MGRALIGMGGNLGDPLDALRFARRELDRHGSVEAVSGIYRTAPVGGPSGQPDYLNAVLVFSPAPAFDSPRELLRLLLDIERAQGRLRRIRWEARTLDLDLLAFDDQVVAEEGLNVPHPLMMERAFVLAPLCELLPDWRNPRTGVSARAALAEVGAGGVERTDLAWEAG